MYQFCVIVHTFVGQMAKTIKVTVDKLYKPLDLLKSTLIGVKWPNQFNMNSELLFH